MSLAFRSTCRIAARVLPIAVLPLLLACASSQPNVEAVDARPLQPGAGEQVDVDQVLVLVDASESLDDGDQFYYERALVESFVAASPDGSYEAGAVSFGGFDRDSEDLKSFDRGHLKRRSARLEHLRNGTPLHKVLRESKDTLSGRSGKVAVVIFSDGLVTDEFGRDVDDEDVVASATELVESYDGTVCFHTVQVGESVEGGALLRRISDVTGCGSTRAASTLDSEPQLYALNRDVYLAAAPVVAEPRPLPPVAAPPPRTSWSIQFPFDSAEVRPQYQNELEEIADQVQATGASVRIDSYTDSKGDVEYNQQLSERRAASTREALIEAGVAADRIQVSGHGEGALLAPDDSDANSQRNRRSEITLVP